MFPIERAGARALRPDGDLRANRSGEDVLLSLVSLAASGAVRVVAVVLDCDVAIAPLGLSGRRAVEDIARDSLFRKLCLQLDTNFVEQVISARTSRRRRL